MQLIYRKVWLIMRLTTFFILLAMVSAWASSNAQSVSFSGRNVTLKSVFDAVKEQTGYTFFYRSEDLRGARPVSLDLKDAPLLDVLDQVFERQHLVYNIQGKTVFVTRKSPTSAVSAGQRGTESPETKNLVLAYPEVRGRVVDSVGQPLAGASIRVLNAEGKRTTLQTTTDDDGYFLLRNTPEDGQLEITYVGHVSQIVVASADVGAVVLKAVPSELEEVEVMVSTGYQTLPKERATGSFVQIGQDLLESRVSTSLIDRLDGMAPGILTNLQRKQRGQGDVEIRGRSTLFSESEPLIILDDFPFEGDLESINPNDIENITVLKDAAAASIWGVRASNGVVVVVTKRGQRGKPVIEFNANLSHAGKQHVFDLPMLNCQQYVEIERFLFEQGKYNTTLNQGYNPVSPVVELLAQVRAGTISEDDGNLLISKIASQDVRGQYNQYFNRPLFNQQYSASARGASASHEYFIAAGLDDNRPQTVSNSFQRWTLQAANSFRFWENRISLSHRVFYSNKVDRQDIYGIPSSPMYPYEQYIDEDGNHLSTVSGLRLSYIDGLSGAGLLDWYLRPLDELNGSDFYGYNRISNLRNSLNISAKLALGFRVSASYLFEEVYQDNPTYYGGNSYYARNQINRFTYLDDGGQLAYGIPVGAIKQVRSGKERNQTGRIQLDYDYRFGTDHQLTALIGTEIRANTGSLVSHGLYGYNEENQTNQNHLVDYTNDFRMWHNGLTSRVPTLTSQSSSEDRFVSYYANLMYAIRDKYRVSLSARRDGSNLFGVDANQRFVPLWSIGGLWDVHKEDFFPEELFSRFQIRASYGFNGNLNRSVSGYLTARRGSYILFYSQPYLEIVNPPNPSLRWEKVKNINVGIDFTHGGGRISGTVEYWQKTGLDLIANRPTATQVGVSGFTGNTASTRSQGLDFSLQTQNIRRAFSWSSQLFASHLTNKVLEYDIVPASNYTILSGVYDYPQISYPHFSIFAFPMRGLEDTGSPVGYLASEETNDYRAIKNSQDAADMKFLGSSVPTFHGTLWNRLSYAGVEFAFSLRFYGGHYFRRESLDNSAIYNNSYIAWDYGQRWQQPGDEQNTNVPALIYPANINRNHFYQYSDLLVEPADHIRFQDLQLSYNAKALATKLHLRELRFLINASDLGVVWTKNEQSLDPVFHGRNASRTVYSFGLKVKI